MKSCFRCLKFLVTFFNGLIMLLGLAIEGSFVWVYFNHAILSNVTSHVTYILYFFMALGAIMAMMGFLGCCGALQESKCMLGTFFFLTLVLFGGQVAVCIWSYVNFKSLEGNFKDKLKDSMGEYYDQGGSAAAIIDALQTNLECCGSNGPSDWKDIQPRSSSSFIPSALQYTVPSSCCVSPNCSTAIFITARLSSSIHHESCSEKIFQWMKDHKIILLSVVIAVSLIQVFALIFSLVLCITFGKIDQYYDY